MILATTVAALTACSSQAGVPEQPATSTLTTGIPTNQSDVPSSSPSEIAVSTSAPLPASGVVVITGTRVQIDDGGYLNLGYLDPATGVVTEYRSFNIPAGYKAKLPGSVGGQASELAQVGANLYGLSPDLTRIAASTLSGNLLRTGWLDQSGTFTDVTPDEGSSRFGEQGVNWEPGGFDLKGDYFFKRTGTGGNQDVFKLGPDQTQGAIKVGETSVTGVVDRFTYSEQDGTVAYLSQIGCDMYDIAPNGIGASTTYPNGVTTVSDCDQGPSLLPPTNANKISDPVISPDAKTIIFKLEVVSNDSSNGTTEIYTIPATGGAPTLLNITGADAASLRLMDWR